MGGNARMLGENRHAQGDIFKSPSICALLTLSGVSVSRVLQSTPSVEHAPKASVT